MERGVCADCRMGFDRDTRHDARFAHAGFRRSRCLDCLGRLLEARTYPDLLDEILPAVRNGDQDRPTTIRVGVWRWDYRSWVWGMPGRAPGGPVYAWGTLGTPEGDEDFCRDGCWRFGVGCPPRVVWEVAASDLRPFFRHARAHVERVDAQRQAARLGLPG